MQHPNKGFLLGSQPHLPPGPPIPSHWLRLGSLTKTVLWETAGRRRPCHCDSEQLIRIMMSSLQCLWGWTCTVGSLHRPTPHQYYEHLEGASHYFDPFIRSHFVSISILCPSFFYSILSPPVNNSKMLLSIHHTAHGHLLFIKLITLSGRVIIIF